MKTVRMAQILEHAGQPETHLAWVEPEKDPQLQRASSQHRVLTIHQRVRGSRKDHAVVGLEPARNAQYLIFPKSLQRFAGARIIAIDYAALRGPVSLSPLPPAPAKPKPSAPVRAPTGKVAGDNVIRFHAPAAEPAPPTPPERTPRREARASPRPAARAKSQRRTPADPVLREVQRALGDLKAGRVARAAERLEVLVSRR